MTEYRIVTAKYDPSGVSVTDPIYKGNYGNILRLVDFPEGMIPETFEMHFSVGGGIAKTQIGTNNEVRILDECLTKVVPITAWLFLHDAATDGETKHEIRIPVKPKDNVTDAEPTPVEQSVITQAIAALNSGVERAETAADAAEEAQEGAEAAATRAEQAAADAQGAAESAAEDAVEAVEQVLEGYKQAAESAATRAENSATDANASRESADQSATNAGISERNARASAEAAAQSATAASGHAQTASQKATQASNYADNASASARSAEAAAGTAEAKASEASASANTASQKAQEAAASAGNTSRSASDAEAAKTGAETAETNAESAATAAAGSASAAQTSAGNAASSATAAAGSASAASGSATAAAQSASNAAATLNSAVQTINAEKATAIQAIQNKGDEVIDSIPADYSELTEDVNSLKSAFNELEPRVDSLEISKADVIISSASGAIASFSDGADGLPVKELVVGIEPVQDLHGYDHPWPGGGGKNLLNYADFSDSSKITSIVDNGDGSFTVTASGAAAWVGHLIPVTSGETYVIKCESVENVSGNATQVGICIVFDGEDTSAPRLINNGLITTQKTFTPSGNYIYLYNSVTGGSGAGVGKIVKPQLEKGSTATAYEPYSNICPISGWTGANVWDDPKYGGLIEWNQQLKDFATGNYGSNYSYAGQYSQSDGIAKVIGTNGTDLHCNDVQIIANHRYLIASDVRVSEATPNIAMRIGSTASGPFPTIAANTWTHISTILSSTANAIRCFILTAQTLTLEAKNFCLFDLTQLFGSGNEPSTVEEFKALFPADYYPYNTGEVTTVSAVNGDPYMHVEIEFPSSAGTVCGGSITVNEDGTGKIVVNRAKFVLDGDEQIADFGVTPLNNCCQVSYVPYLSAGKSGNNFIASTLSPGSTAKLYGIWGSSVPRMFMGLPLSITTREDAIAWFADNPTEVVYELATPITYDLTALEVLETLKGVNNIWSDANGDTSVTYRADTKLYIDGKIAEAIANALNT